MPWFGNHKHLPKWDGSSTGRGEGAVLASGVCDGMDYHRGVGYIYRKELDILFF